MRIDPIASMFGLALLLAADPSAAQTAAPPSPADAPWTAPPPALATPPVASAHDDAAEAEAVERLLATLDADARERRVIGLAVGLGGGAATMGLGAWMLLRRDAPRWEQNPGTYLGAAGVGLMLGGVLNAVLPPYLHELRDTWEQSAGLPVATRRARFGARLDELANQARSARRVAGWLSLGLGATALAASGVAYAARSDASDRFDSLSFVVGVSGAMLMATSVPALTIPSPIEHAQRFWRAGDARPSVRLAGLSVLPARGGAVASLALTF